MSRTERQVTVSVIVCDECGQDGFRAPDGDDPGSGAVHTIEAGTVRIDLCSPCWWVKFGEPDFQRRRAVAIAAQPKSRAKRKVSA